MLLWNLFATARSKITRNATARNLAAGNDEGYRRLAARAVDAQERTVESLAELNRTLEP